MTLYHYRRPRLVVLQPSSSVLEAARAIEQNRIGAVVVQDRGRIAGIVTDRDLAVRAVGRALDARTTPVADVMTLSPVTLTPEDSTDDAIELMQVHNVRRIPIVEGERVVGMVTLDDLLLDEAAPLEQLAAIVHAQIGEGGPAESARSPGRRRGLARAEATLTRLLNQVRAEAGLDSPEQARIALDSVLASVVRRLTPAEASDFIAQLPSLLHAPLRAHRTGPDRSITRDAMAAELAARMGLEPDRTLRIIAAVAHSVAKSISRGAVEHVRTQLPEEFREVLSARQPAARP